MNHEYFSPEYIAQLVKHLSEKKERSPKDSRLQITFDKQAADKVLELFFRENSPNLKPQVRVYIEGKGCDGFFYGVAFDTRNEHDFVFNHDQFDIIVDPESLLFVYGSRITWATLGDKEGFLVNNPQHQRFKGKFYKKSAWKNVFQDSQNG